MAEAHGLARGQIESLLAELAQEERLLRGSFVSRNDEWCEPTILRRIKRRTLAKLRNEIEPVKRSTFARLLPAWHGLDKPGRGLGRLEKVIQKLEGMPLSYGALERAILPARVSAFEPRQFDELGAMGVLVWVGRSALGRRDGRIELYRRGQISKLLAEPVVPEGLSQVARSLLTQLQARGACFFVDLQSAHEDVPNETLLESLWELVWAGLVTNDTFRPLRTLTERRRKQSAVAPSTGGRRPRPRRSLRRPDRQTIGRWSLVSQWMQPVSDTHRLHAQALMLLERHGIVSREVASRESLAGGFRAIYPLLRGMEEAGKVRRGYFVEGIGGAQFALAGAIDRLRGLERADRELQPSLLSASDPANPYGWIVPWPAQPDGVGRVPKRHSDATLVLIDGEPTLFLNRGGVLLTFSDRPDGALQSAVRALCRHVTRRRPKPVRIQHIDDCPALQSPLSVVLKEAGVSCDHRGFVIERAV